MYTHGETKGKGRRLGAMLVVASAITAAACASDSTGVPASTRSQLLFTTGSGALGASAALAPVTAGGHTLDLTAATLTISRAELKRAQTDSCAGDEDGDNDGNQNGNGDHGSNHDEHQGSGQDGNSGSGNCGELKVGTTTVSLPLGDSVVTIPADSLPAGTFQELELRVSQVELKGKFDTTSFDDTIAVNAKAEIKFSTPLVVTKGVPTSVTVNVPVLSWLTNPDSTLVDPTKLSTSPSLLAQVRNRILASFRAFEDRNHDGRDDH